MPDREDPRGVLPGLGQRTWNDTSLFRGPSGEGSFRKVFSFPCIPGCFRPRTGVSRIDIPVLLPVREPEEFSGYRPSPLIRGSGGRDCVPPFPPQGFSIFPSEEGRKEIFCGSLNASFNASSEEETEGEAFPGWDPGIVGTCVPYAEAFGGPYPFRGSRGNPFRKAQSATTPKGGFGWVLRIGTGARSNVRPKRIV